MLKKLLPVIFMLTCAMFAPASAQTAVSTEKQTAIKELVRLITDGNKMEDLLAAMVPQMQAQSDATLKALIEEDKVLSTAEKKALADSIAADKRYSVKRMMDKMTERINFNELMDEIAYSVYDKHFTLEEIRDLTAFYKTPTGQKALKTMAPVMTDTMTAMQERVMPKMMIVIKEIVDEDRADIEQKVKAAKSRPKKSGGK